MGIPHVWPRSAPFERSAVQPATPRIRLGLAHAVGRPPVASSRIRSMADLSRLHLATLAAISAFASTAALISSYSVAASRALPKVYEVRAERSGVAQDGHRSYVSPPALFPHVGARADV